MGAASGARRLSSLCEAGYLIGALGHCVAPAGQFLSLSLGNAPAARLP